MVTKEGLKSAVGWTLMFVGLALVASVMFGWYH
jgi:hypothetical protein